VKRKIALGPGAASLILIVVALSLAMMAMLTIIAAKNDYSLCFRSASMIEKVYELNAASEKRLAELDAVVAKAAKEQSGNAFLETVGKNLPEGMTLEGDQVTWSEPLENRTLNCAVQITGTGDQTRLKWVTHKLTVNEPEEDWEW
jgi:hypothetical protein